MASIRNHCAGGRFLLQMKEDGLVWRFSPYACQIICASATNVAATACQLQYSPAGCAKPGLVQPFKSLANYAGQIISSFIPGSSVTFGANSNSAATTSNASYLPGCQ